MKRAFCLTIVFTCLLATTAVAAGNESSKRGGFSFEQFGSGKSIVEVIAKFQERHKTKNNNKPKPDDRIPIDPGMGNGKPPVQPTVPQGRPGFVWVGDHWERQRATSTPKYPTMITDPAPGSVVVRDHRRPVVAPSGGPIVRDHRTPGPFGVLPGGGTSGVWSPSTPTNGGPIIRDHRTPRPNVLPGSGTSGTWSPNTPVVRDHRTQVLNVGGAPGGVVVTGTPRPKSHGGGLLDTLGDAASGVGKTVGKAVVSAGHAVGVGYGTITPAGGTPSATIRDHRSK